MNKYFLLAVVMLVTISGFSQDGGTASPYSFYGIGNQQFKGTVENRSMGGMSVFSDSLHLNLTNPAALGQLRFVTFTFGGSHTETSFEDTASEDNASATSIDYLSFGFPLSDKLGVGFGLMPYTSVGYKLNGDTDKTISRFTGRGGLNRVYLSAGYEILEGLTAGVSANYNFGNIQNTSFRTEEGVEFGTEERNRSDLQGFSLDLGVQYERPLNERLTLHTSLGYTPAAAIDSENARTIASVIFNDAGQTADIDARELNVPDSEFDLPSILSIGGGIGEDNKWFAGLEYRLKTSSNFTNRSFTLDNATFEDASQVRLGGFYVPKYKSVTSYWERVSYRAGFRYEETGIVINNESINEFGMSFGLGLPAGRLFSNGNLGFEYGQRGTTDANLVKETFFNVFISFSLNDIWFQQTKFN